MITYISKVWFKQSVELRITAQSGNILVPRYLYFNVDNRIICMEEPSVKTFSEILIEQNEIGKNRKESEYA